MTDAYQVECAARLALTLLSALVLWRCARWCHQQANELATDKKSDGEAAFLAGMTAVILACGALGVGAVVVVLGPEWLAGILDPEGALVLQKLRG